MSSLFHEHPDITIRFILVFMIFGEVFYGYLKMNDIKDNLIWFNHISNHIIGIQKVWMIHLLRIIVYFSLAISMFFFYRNSSNILHTNYVLDTITILFLINNMLDNLWIFIFFELRLTFIALIMEIIVLVSSIIIITIFGVYDKWVEFGTFFVYLLWNVYIVYINSMFLYLEENRYITEEEEEEEGYHHIYSSISDRFYRIVKRDKDRKL